MNSLVEDEADPLDDFFLISGLEALDVIWVDLYAIEGVWKIFKE